MPCCNYSWTDRQQVETINPKGIINWHKKILELRIGIEGISQKVLTQNLRSMEEDGIIKHQVFAEVTPLVDDLGISLRPILSVMEEWD